MKVTRESNPELFKQLAVYNALNQVLKAANADALLPIHEAAISAMRRVSAINNEWLHDDAWASIRAAFNLPADKGYKLNAEYDEETAAAISFTAVEHSEEATLTA